jgi:hypothetical protein
MCGWGEVKGGQNLASREKVWSALSTSTPDIEYLPTRFSKKFVFPRRLIVSIHSKGLPIFVVSTAAKGDQESVGAELDIVPHHDRIDSNEFNREGINNKFHLNVNCTVDDIDDAFFEKTVSQFGVEEACKVTVEPFVTADKFDAEAKARHESLPFFS